jgi:ParB/RepB/Spo0J family partition protein
MSVSRDTVPVALIDPDPEQPRQHVDEEQLAELASSIASNGLAVPILVRPVGDRFLIVHGERRWRAVTRLGWADVPAEVRELDDSSARWLQLVENINRADLSPIEEARAYRGMLDTGETQQSLAERIGKTRSYIAQKLRLLDLPAPLTLLTDRGALSEGHVRQLLRIRALYTDAHSFGGDPDAWANVDLFDLLVMSRPEDWPPGYPNVVGAAGKHAVLEEAKAAWCGEISATLGAGDRYPRWTVAAFYFAALTVCASASVATLDRVIDGWIARIHAALLWTRDCAGHIENGPDGRQLRVVKSAPPWSWMNRGPGYQRECVLWHGHRSDLRHAGLDVENSHIDELTVFEGALRDGAMALPSGSQPGAPHHDMWVKIADACEGLGE